VFGCLEGVKRRWGGAGEEPRLDFAPLGRQHADSPFFELLFGFLHVTAGASHVLALGLRSVRLWGMVVALFLVAAIAAIWWLVRRKGWGTLQKVVFWVVLLAVLWVVVNFYVPPHPGG
jgi:hypothetical protein